MDDVDLNNNSSMMKRSVMKKKIMMEKNGNYCGERNNDQICPSSSYLKRFLCMVFHVPV